MTEVIPRSRISLPVIKFDHWEVNVFHRTVVLFRHHKRNIVQGCKIEYAFRVLFALSLFTTAVLLFIDAIKTRIELVHMKEEKETMSIELR